MNTSEYASVEINGEIGFVTLRGTDEMNLFGIKALEFLARALDEIKRDYPLRALIIMGEKNFSAGADLNELKEINAEQAETFCRLGHEVCKKIEDFEQPVIAAINGYALGGGLELALACDIRIAEEGAKMGFPELGIGLIPGFGGTMRLVRLIGPGMSREMLFTGRILDGLEAESKGLINKMVKKGDLKEKAVEMASIIAGKSPIAARFEKELINGALEIQGGQHIFERELAYFYRCFAAEDRIEGINAFFEKRKPDFKGE